MSRKDKFIMRLPLFEDASHDTDPPYRPRAVAAYTAVNIGAASLAVLAEAAALAGDMPEGTEQAVGVGALVLLASAIVSEAYILLHWKPERFPQRIAFRRLETLDRGFLSRAQKESDAIDAARSAAFFERIEADNRPSVEFFQTSLYLDDEEGWVLETEWDAREKVAVSD